MRNIQKQRRNVPADDSGLDVSSPAIAADVSGLIESSVGEEVSSLSLSAVEVPNTPKISPISTDLGIINEVPRALADSGVGAVEEKINQSASEVSSSHASYIIWSLQVSSIYSCSLGFVINKYLDTLNGSQIFLTLCTSPHLCVEGYWLYIHESNRRAGRDLFWKFCIWFF